MEGSFIPPPFPFPEAWPRVFADQRNHQERKWLSPKAFDPVQRHASTAAKPTDPLPVAASPLVAKPQGRNEVETDGEYEVGYILSDEWRERFQSSTRLQQLQRQERLRNTKSKKRQQSQQKQAKQQRQTSNTTKALSAITANRSSHLHHEIQAARTRELAQHWKRQGNSSLSPDSPVAALETSLNALFDEFCDTYQPVMWPHDPLQV